ncbi:MAG: hypothetical protein Q9202_004476 [Teloschistes flavicans]
MVARFIYEPLRHERCFRLLKFEPQGADSSIRCTMSEYCLDDNIDYSTLSYTWGPPEAPEAMGSQSYQQYEVQRDDIFVNDAILCIGLNLRDALIRLRHLDPNIVLWVDAICINQGDLIERSSQVTAMADIYGNCTEVIVWLGEEHTDTCDTLDLIQSIANASTARDLEGRFVNRGIFGPQTHKDPDALVSIGIPTITACRWEALVSFYFRRWFERLWVVQEVALPKNTPAYSGLLVDPLPSTAPIGQPHEAIRVICGSFIIIWEEILECAYFLICAGIAGGLSSSEGLPADIRLVNVHQLGTLRAMCHGRSTPSHYESGFSDAAGGLGEGDPYVDLCRAFGLREGVYDPNAHFSFFGFMLSSWHCTDPKDKVYALLGILERIRHMFSPDESPFMIADYSKSVEQVYCEATSVVLRNSQRLDILPTIPDPSFRNYSTLPSWVADTPPIKLTPWMIGGSEAERAHQFDAAKGHGHADLSFRDGGKILQVHGSRVGQVADIGETTTDWYSDLSFEASAALVLKCNETYINGQGRLEALWRTLITDQEGSTYPAPESIGLLFFKYLRAMFTMSIWRQIIHADSQVIGNKVPKIKFPKSPNIDRLAESDATQQMPSIRGALENCLKAMKDRTLGEAYELEVADYNKSLSELYENTNIASHTYTRLFRTHHSLLGMGPGSVTEGDEIWLLKGANVPMVLRPNPENGRYQLIGPAYVHGIMHGEALEMGQPNWEDIELE